MFLSFFVHRRKIYMYNNMHSESFVRYWMWYTSMCNV